MGLAYVWVLPSRAHTYAPALQRSACAHVCTRMRTYIYRFFKEIYFHTRWVALRATQLRWPCGPPSIRLPNLSTGFNKKEWIIEEINQKEIFWDYLTKKNDRSRLSLKRMNLHSFYFNNNFTSTILVEWPCPRAGLKPCTRWAGPLNCGPAGHLDDSTASSSFLLDKRIDCMHLIDQISGINYLFF